MRVRRPARHNAREADTIDQMAGIIAGMEGKQLRYRELIADTGMANGARGTRSKF